MLERQKGAKTIDREFNISLEKPTELIKIIRRDYGNENGVLSVSCTRKYNFKVLKAQYQKDLDNRDLN